ncbi:hypothetical protein D3C86_1163980 [compost metagenome]
MQALAARGLDESGKPGLFETPFQFQRRLDHLFPCHILAGVDIHGDHVRLFPIGGGHAPWVDFKRGRLHERHQAIKIGDADQRFTALVLGIPDLLNRLVDAAPGMFLEEALPLNPFRAAQQCQRPVDDKGRDVPPDLRIIIGKPLLRHAIVRPVQPVRMGELDRRLRRLGVGHGLLLAFDFSCGLVFAQPPERGMTQIAISRPCAKLHFRH